MDRSYQIFLADDHVMFRRGMRRLIEETPGMVVVGEAGDGVELLTRLATVQPDLVILDISMPRIGGVGGTREIRKRHPRVKVLILTMHKNTEYLYTAIATGAHGYLLKEDSDIELFQAIKSIRAGKTYVTGKIAGDLAGEIAQLLKNRGNFPCEPLSVRERQVLQLIAEGKLNREIADILHISVRTVENHRARLMKKLKLNKTADLVRYAIQQGIVELSM
jgi:DNA-binding NarL/FixJ family response regulator